MNERKRRGKRRREIRGEEREKGGEDGRTRTRGRRVKSRKKKIEQ